MNMAAAVLLIFSQLKRATEALLVSPRPDQIPSQLKNDHHFRASNISAVYSRLSRGDLVYLSSKVSCAAPTGIELLKALFTTKMI